MDWSQIRAFIWPTLETASQGSYGELTLRETIVSIMTYLFGLVSVVCIISALAVEANRTPMYIVLPVVITALLGSSYYMYYTSIRGIRYQASSLIHRQEEVLLLFNSEDRTTRMVVVRQYQIEQDLEKLSPAAREYFHRSFGRLLVPMYMVIDTHVALLRDLGPKTAATVINHLGPLVDDGEDPDTDPPSYNGPPHLRLLD